jgi:hypothetical protein
MRGFVRRAFTFARLIPLRDRVFSSARCLLLILDFGSILRFPFCLAGATQPKDKLPACIYIVLNYIYGNLRHLVIRQFEVRRCQKAYLLLRFPSCFCSLA